MNNYILDSTFDTIVLTSVLHDLYVHLKKPAPAALSQLNTAAMAAVMTSRQVQYVVLAWSAQVSASLASGTLVIELTCIDEERRSGR
jgi:hypothetical protein